MSHLFLRCWGAGFILLCLVGCNSSSSVSEVSGHYEGSLITHLNGRYLQSSVRTDIAPIPETAGPASETEVLKDPSGATQLTLSLSNISDSSIQVQSSLVLTQPVLLTYDPNENCYSSKNGLQITLCASSPEISFEVDDASGNSLLSLVLYRFAPETDLGAGEKPQVYTLTAAIDRARTMNFEAKIEFEHVIQAKDLANAAYMHLLPQITLGTVANNLAPAFSTALQCIGDLAPFLLPSRWLQANAASDQSRAEQDAERIMRLDMGAQIEGLFYTYDRDRRSLAIYGAIRNQFKGIRADVLKREQAGQLPEGSADNVAAVLEELEHSSDVFKQVTSEDLAAISQSLGFYSPLAVQDARIDQEVFPIDNAPSVDFNTVNSAAISRSFELDQMDWLISAAQLNKVSEYFAWLDPESDSGLGLGAALPSEIDVAQSQINELNIDRDEVKSILSEKAFDAVKDYNEALEYYADELKDQTLQVRRLNETLSQLDSGQKIEIATLMDIMDDYVENQTEIEEARSDYRVARSEIDRLTLQGYYAKF